MTMPTGTMPLLKAATWEVHQRLERRLGIQERFSTRDRYAAHLAALWGFYSVAEEAWSPLLTDALPDLVTRRKAPLLERDLKTLGAWPAVCAPDPGQDPGQVPALADEASALGGFYVLEGATLGGRHLLPLAGRSIGVTAEAGAAFLASYGNEVPVMWQRFGAAVEARCLSPEAKAQAVAGALATFLGLEHWLTGPLSHHGEGMVTP